MGLLKGVRGMNLKEYLLALFGIGVGAFFVGLMFYMGYKVGEITYETSNNFSSDNFSSITIDYHAIARAMGVSDNVVLGMLIVVGVVSFFIIWVILTTLVIDETFALKVETILVGSLFLSIWLASKGHGIIAAVVFFVGLLIVGYLLLLSLIHI